MKCSLCFLALLTMLALPVQALHIEIDGHVSNSEYGQKQTVLIPGRNESNNDVSSAYLLYALSEADHCLYVGVRYICADVGVLLEQQAAEPPEEGVTSPIGQKAMTGIELTINGKTCMTAWLDNTVTGLDVDQYRAEAKFKFYRNADSDDPELNTFDGEICLGIKRWIPYDSVLEIRVMDCKGIPSNYYPIRINPAPTAAESSAAQKSTTKSSTVSAASTVTTVQTTATTAPRAARPVITAASGAPRSSVPAPSEPESKRDVSAAATSKATARHTARPPSEPTQETSTAAETHAARAVVPDTESITTELPATTADLTAADAAGAQRYFVMGRIKLVGAAAAAALITGAVMIAVFAGIRKPTETSADEPPTAPEPQAPDEEDDF